jgi:hypothetical protein
MFHFICTVPNDKLPIAQQAGQAVVPRRLSPIMCLWTRPSLGKIRLKGIRYKGCGNYLNERHSRTCPWAAPSRLLPWPPAVCSSLYDGGTGSEQFR